MELRRWGISPAQCPKQTVPKEPGDGIPSQTVLKPAEAAVNPLGLPKMRVSKVLWRRMRGWG